MKVAHILSGKRAWGVENYVYNLLRAERAAGLEPTIICAMDGVIANKFRNAGFDVHVIPMRSYVDYDSVFKLASLYTKNEIDVIHTHLGLDSFLGTVAGKICHKPVIMSVHFDEPNYMSFNSVKRQLWKEAQVIKNKSIAYFLPITENVAIQLAQRESVALNKLTVVHPGIPAFECDRSRRSLTRTEHGIAESDVLIVGVGRLEKEKNFSCVLDAFSLFEKTLATKLWVVGDGSQREHLKNQIERLQLQDRVQMLGYQPDIKDLLFAADIFVLASKQEPFGMSAVEAMLSSLPVVATIGPGLSTIVEHEVTGILVQPNSPDELYSALKRLVESKELREGFGNAGRQRALNLFTSERMADQIVTIYHQIVEANLANAR